MDTANADDALKATERYAELAAPATSAALCLRAIARRVLLGDLAGSARDFAASIDIGEVEAVQRYADPLSYYVLGDLERGDAARGFHERFSDTYYGDAVAAAYRHLVTGDVAQARELALPLFLEHKDYSAIYEDTLIARLAVDALIDRGEARLAIDIIEDMAPPYAGLRKAKHVEPEGLSPAPYPVKSTYSSYPALYYPDYIRALEAAGDTRGAGNMLNHLEAVLHWRRTRGLLVEERHAAEARALRGDYEGALDALEQALRDRTIFHGWHVFLLHNAIFAELSADPRFMAIVTQVREDVRGQRAELVASH